MTQEKRTPSQVIALIVKLLFDEGAMDWVIQDKGALLAAIKLQLRERRKASG